ncbi:uncharacterized protein EDB91DRAFT_1092335, partial [Suillus paluster]|uniref:uncharacterized protein n=1 Tax=Suillus paluster TaxID=48578 RepID=UPI001B88165C
MALCRQKQVRAAMKAFDLAFTFTSGESNRILFLIKVIAFLNASEYEEAMLRVEDLVATPNADPLPCRIVEVTILRSVKPKFMCRHFFCAFCMSGISICPTGNHFS